MPTVGARSSAAGAGGYGSTWVGLGKIVGRCEFYSTTTADNAAVLPRAADPGPKSSRVDFS